jgi:hypothetical protein
MSFQLNGFDLSSARVSIPWSGVWFADISLTDGKALTIGDRANLVLSDLTMVGTILSGGEYVGRSNYMIVGGYAGWSKVVLRRPYRSDDAVKLSEVIADLARESGEKLALEPGTDRKLGYAWTRLGGTASSALRDLVGSSWWVAPDGITHVGMRPATTVPSSVKLVLEEYDPRWKRATISCPDDKIAAFMPRATFSADNIPNFTIASVDLCITPGSVRLEVLG